jgi:hypothetical protein
MRPRRTLSAIAMKLEPRPESKMPRFFIELILYCLLPTVDSQLQSRAT